jgi:hypothetical protein
MSQYLLLIHTDERAFLALSEEERNAITREYFAYTDGLRDAGAYVAAAPLEPTSVAASAVRVRDGKELVTDGPFAETKEQLGGFFLVEADSLEEACEHAARMPGARFGAIEVRQIRPVPAEAPA